MAASSMMSMTSPGGNSLKSTSFGIDTRCGDVDGAASAVTEEEVEVNLLPSVRGSVPSKGRATVRRSSSSRRIVVEEARVDERSSQHGHLTIGVVTRTTAGSEAGKVDADDAREENPVGVDGKEDEEGGGDQNGLYEYFYNALVGLGGGDDDEDGDRNGEASSPRGVAAAAAAMAGPGASPCGAAVHVARSAASPSCGTSSPQASRGRSAAGSFPRAVRSLSPPKSPPPSSSHRPLAIRSSSSLSLTKCLSFESNASSLSIVSGGGGGSRSASPTPGSPHYQPYFDKKDFTDETWTEVLGDWERSVPAVGLAVFATAAVIVKPLVFIAGVMWAVGVFHAVDHGYEYFSDNSFSSLFWDDEPTAVGDGDAAASHAPSGATEAEAIALQQERVRLAKVKAEKIDTKMVGGIREDDEEEDGGGDRAPAADASAIPDGAKRESDSACRFVSADAPTPKRGRRSSPVVVASEQVGDLVSSGEHAQTSSQLDLSLSMADLFEKHFPPLETECIKGVKFHGLNALEFFNVYFSNNAPYSLKEFQQKRGDIDVVFGDWEAVPSNTPCSFKAVEDLTPFPNASMMQRVLTFKTLTKSYFGPAYATATKTQRVTKISKNRLVLENRTQLSDIPFSDRFYVIERWVVDAFKNDVSKALPLNSSKSWSTGSFGERKRASSLDVPAQYTSRLAVYVEVCMVRSCTWEAQIRKKTSATVTDLVNNWCKKATAALKVTEQRKLERLGSASIHSKRGSEHSLGSSLSSAAAKGSKANSLANLNEDKENHLMAVHLNKLNELEKKIAAGDLEWCSIEVQHSWDAGRKSAFAKVLNPQGGGHESDSNPANQNGVSARAADSDLSSRRDDAIGKTTSKANPKRSKGKSVLNMLKRKSKTKNA